MKFLADENVDKPIVESLREQGHVVYYLLESDLGAADDKVIQEANKQSGLLITADKDFGELVFRQGHITGGVILIRLAGLSSRHKADLVSKVIKKHKAELTGNFTVITPGAVRIRRSK